MLSNLDSPSSHFAVGMICSGLLMIPVLVYRFRYWVYVPIVQTLGGMFAEVPDYPKGLQYFPSLGVHRLIDTGALYETLHTWGNLFFFHSAIDSSGRGNFLQGFVVAVVIYNFWLFIFVYREMSRR